MQVIIFQVNDLYYGLSTESVEEITGSLKSTTLPKSESWIQGLVNLRGDVLTLVNMKNLLEMDDNEKDECYNNTIIINLEENNIALMVDSVIGVTDVGEDELHPARDNEHSAVVSLLSVYDQVVNILDLNSLF